MAYIRCVSSLSLALLLAACASAPGPSSRGSASNDLRLCGGGIVSNAPRSDARGEVVDFAPVVRLRGNTLLRAPVAGCLSSGFGPRRGGAGSFHKGIDLYTGRPRAVLAGGAGVVTFVGRQRGYGRVVIISHERGVETRYAHLSSIARGLSPGDRIVQSERIAMTGDTGNASAVHLHYEILVDGQARDPLTLGM